MVHVHRRNAVAVVHDQGAAGVEHVVVDHGDDAIGRRLYRGAGRRGNVHAKMGPPGLAVKMRWLP